MTLRGELRNGGVILPNARRPEGTLVEVTPLNEKAGDASGAAILVAVEKLLKVPREWVDELEQAIVAGHMPPSPPVAFSDRLDSEGND
jgi:hypothetical protein